MPGLEQGTFPWQHWEDSELKVGFPWDPGTEPLGWREKNLGWKARASGD